MSDCSEMRERLSAALDGELTDGERAALARHISSCPECRSWQDASMRVHERMQKIWRRVDLSPREERRLQSAAARELSRDPVRHPGLALRRLASLAAAVLLLTAAVAFLLRNRPVVTQHGSTAPPPVVAISPGEVLPVILGPATRLVAYGPAVLSCSRWPHEWQDRDDAGDLLVEMGTIDVEHRTTASPFVVRIPQGEVEMAAAIVRIEVAEAPEESSSMRLLSGQAWFRDASGSVALTRGRPFVAAGNAGGVRLASSPKRTPLTPTAPARPEDLVVGRVEDAAGRTVAGAPITATCLRPIAPLLWRGSTRTDPGGFFSIRFPKASTRHRIDIGPTDETIARRFDLDLGFLAGAPSPHRFVVEHGGQIEGTVFTTDGVPLAGAEVFARSKAPVGGLFFLDSGVRRTRCDRYGRFVIPHIGPNFTVSAGHSGFAPLVAVNGLVGEGQTVTGLELPLTPAASLQGTVRDSSAQPLEHATVRLLLASTERTISGALEESPPRLPTTWTDARGRYRLDAIPAGLPVLVLADEIHHVGSRSVRTRLEADTVGEIDFELHQGSEVRGQILDSEGRPLSSCIVAVVGNDESGWHSEGLPRLSDTQGRFAVAGLSAGHKLLVVIAAGMAPAILPVDVPDASTFELPREIVLGPGQEIRGIVHAPGGRPVPGVRVGVRLRIAGELSERGLAALADLLPGTTTRTARTDEDGAFRIRGLGNGIYDVGPLPSTEGERGSTSSALPLDEASAHPQIQPGGPPIDVWLTEDTLPLELAVDLWSQDSEIPIDWFYYRLIKGEPPGVESSGVLQRRDGPPRLRVSIARPFQIEFGAPGHAPRRVTVPSGSRSTHRIEVALERGAVIRGQVVDRAGRPLPGTFLEFKDAQGRPVSLRAGPDGRPVRSLRIGSSGRFELRAVPSGPLRLEAHAPIHSTTAAQTTKTIKLSRGEVRNVILRLTR